MQETMEHAIEKRFSGCKICTKKMYRFCIPWESDLESSNMGIKTSQTAYLGQKTAFLQILSICNISVNNQLSVIFDIVSCDSDITDSSVLEKF